MNTEITRLCFNVKGCEEVSMLVQEVAFNLGYSWRILGKEAQWRNEEYLLLDTKDKSISYSMGILQDDGTTLELDTKSFILTKGDHVKVVDKSKEYSFSDDNACVKYKGTLDNYLFNVTFSFYCKKDDGGVEAFSECYLVPEILSFADFLKDNGCYYEYITNSRMENQRWYYKSSYRTKEELKKCNPLYWINNAFNWTLSSKGSKYWRAIEDKWMNIYREAKEEGRDIVWQ